jgi:hypothetical protein
MFDAFPDGNSSAARVYFPPGFFAHGFLPVSLM